MHSKDAQRSGDRAETEDVRKYATEQGVSEQEALQKGMEEKSREFAEKGSELYAKRNFSGVLKGFARDKNCFKIAVDNSSELVHIHIKMSKELDMAAVENCVCFNLRWVTRAVTQFYDAEMRRHGIRPTQESILASLQTKDSWTMAELSDWLGMDRTTLVRNLRPLQRDGFVQVAGGGRGTRVELKITAKGRKQIEKLAPAWKSAQSAVVKTLGEERWSAILSDLETAALALNNK